MSAPLAIGGRRELFVDDWLIETLSGAWLQLRQPERREVALRFDAPEEDADAFPYRVLSWHDGFRLYYRACIFDAQREEEHTVVALAESRDGIAFARPDLGLVGGKGSSGNNLLQWGGVPNVPPPFVDTNPAAGPDQRFKGLFADSGARVYAMASPDGAHWKLMREAPLELPGQFDTINTAFWDVVAGCYRCYTRSWYDFKTGRVQEAWKPVAGANFVRSIQHATSPDFIHWSRPEPVQYADTPDFTHWSRDRQLPYADLGHYVEHIYTNAILPCPGAEHLYLGFPNRFVSHRKASPSHPYKGINDALFMSSRDGVRWNRWLDAWVRPGLDELNWTDRNNYPVWGILETSPTEWSMYITEHYRHAPTQVRRLAIRPWGFVSLHADFGGGEVVTKPFTFAGDVLHLNASTSAAGTIQVEVQDEQGHPVPGFALAEMDPWFGDALDAPMAWKNAGDLGGLAGRPVRLRFALQDADVYGFRFAEAG